MKKVVVCGAYPAAWARQSVGWSTSHPDFLGLVGGINLKPGSFFGAEIVESKNAESFLQRTRPDVLIDFTIAQAAVGNVKMAEPATRSRWSSVPTGFSGEQRAEMEQAIRGNVPGVISSNFSMGVNIFWQNSCVMREGS